MAVDGSGAFQLSSGSIMFAKPDLAGSLRVVGLGLAAHELPGQEAGVSPAKQQAPCASRPHGADPGARPSRLNSTSTVRCYTDKGVEKSRCGVVCQWLVVARWSLDSEALAVHSELRTRASRPSAFEG